ncbi:MAG: hypothetical protein U0359_33975 [Byssovorax sp.]
MSSNHFLRPAWIPALLGLAALLGAACGPEKDEPARSDCATCHLPDFKSASHHEGVRPLRCEVCHTSHAWHPTGLHHDTFELTGAHLALAKKKCFACHWGEPPRFEGTPDACWGCHSDKFENNPVPGHKNNPITCDDCHATDAWKPTLPGVKKPTGPAAPTATATATATAPTATATAPAPKPTVTAPKPPPTTITPKPPPTTVTPKPPPTTNPPIVTGASRRRR